MAAPTVVGAGIGAGTGDSSDPTKASRVERALVGAATGLGLGAGAGAALPKLLNRGNKKAVDKVVNNFYDPAAYGKAKDQIKGNLRNAYKSQRRSMGSLISKDGVDALDKKVLNRSLIKGQINQINADVSDVRALTTGTMKGKVTDAKNVFSEVPNYPGLKDIKNIGKERKELKSIDKLLKVTKDSNIADTVENSSMNAKRDVTKAMQKAYGRK